jgi:hypothetical protein
LSSFFLVATIVNAAKWAFYLYLKDYSGLGHVQYWLIGGLAINFVFNLPMKSLIFFQNGFVVIFAALINSVSISYIIGLNLVLLHGISAPTDLSVKWFYIPKLVIIFPVFIAMLFD